MTKILVTDISDFKNASSPSFQRASAFKDSFRLRTINTVNVRTRVVLMSPRLNTQYLSISFLKALIS